MSVTDYYCLVSFSLQGGGDGKFDMVGRKTDGYISVIGELDYDHGQRQYDLNVTVTVSEKCLLVIKMC